MILWGTLTCLMAVVKSYKHVLILRIFIGCIEAGFAPGVLLRMSPWFSSSSTFTYTHVQLAAWYRKLT